MKMLTIERMVSSLQSMHRHIYFNVNSLSDDQLQEFYHSLEQQEEGNAELRGVTIRDVEKNDAFDCNFVVMMVWRLMGDGSKAGGKQAFFKLENESECGCATSACYYCNRFS